MNDFVYEKMKTIYPIANAVKARKDGEFLVLANDRFEFQFLNSIAMEVYYMCDGQNNIEAIVSRLYDQYDVGIKQLEEDVIELMRDLLSKRLIKLKRYLEAI